MVLHPIARDALIVGAVALVAFAATVVIRFEGRWPVDHAGEAALRTQLLGSICTGEARRRWAVPTSTARAAEWLADAQARPDELVGSDAQLQGYAGQTRLVGGDLAYTGSATCSWDDPGEYGGSGGSSSYGLESIGQTGATAPVTVRLDRRRQLGFDRVEIQRGD